MGLRVRIPPKAWMSVSYECRVLKGRGPCDGPIIRREDSYGLWLVIVYDLETSRLRTPWPRWAVATQTDERIQEELRKLARAS